jgi:hypothetical protein
MNQCFCLIVAVIAAIIVLFALCGADGTTMPSIRTERFYPPSQYRYKSSWGDNVSDGAVWADNDDMLIDNLDAEQYL